MKTFILTLLISLSVYAQKITVPVGAGGGVSQAQLTAGLAGKADTVHTHVASDIVSGALDKARLAAGTWATNTVLGFDASGNPTWTNLFGGLTLVDTILGQSQGIVEAISSSTNIIVDVQAQRTFSYTLAHALTYFTFTNFPSSSGRELFCSVRLIGDGSRDAQILNEDLSPLGPVTTNNLPATETVWELEWSGNAKGIYETPHPYLAGLDKPIAASLSEKISNPGSLAQGDILYFDGSAWARLGAGTSGQFLKTQGAAANPVWDTPSGGSGGYTLVLATTAVGNAADGATYYSGNDYNSSLQTSYTNVSVRIPKSGTIKSATVRVRATAGASTESVAHYLDINSGATTLEINTNSSYAPAVVEVHQTFNQAVTAGEYIALKVVCPTWATNPTNVRWWCLVYIEP